MSIVAKIGYWSFGVYNLLLGLAAMFFPTATASLFAISDPSNNFLSTERYLGALAVAIGYACIVGMRDNLRNYLNLVAISTVLSFIVGALSLITDQTATATVLPSLVIQVVFILAFLADRQTAASSKKAAA